MLAGAKRIGKGDVLHHPIISDADLNSLYTSMHLAMTTPQGIFKRVKFDIRIFFNRRGNENIYYMTKYTFQVDTDENTGRRIVKKVVDDQTKNRRFDKESASGIMPDIQGLYNFVLMFYSFFSKDISVT